jgi:hypothetical protein
MWMLILVILIMLVVVGDCHGVDSFCPQDFDNLSLFNDNSVKGIQSSLSNSDFQGYCM